MIHSLQVPGMVVYDYTAMAEVAFNHFEELLGISVDREFSLDPDFLDSHLEDLSDLDAPFTKVEVCEVVRRLPHDKVPSPDGFTAEFLELLDHGEGQLHGCFHQVLLAKRVWIPGP